MKTVSSEEFERFWSEVLGDDWYMEEGLEDYDPERDDVVELDDWYVRWQGPRKVADEDIPPAPPHVKKNEYDPLHGITTGLRTLFERWKKAQTHTTVVARFVVPKERAGALVNRLKVMDAEVQVS